MLPLTTKEPFRFIPEESKQDPETPTYLIGVPTIAGRAEFRKELRQNRVQFIKRNDVLDALIDGIKVHAIKEDVKRTIKIVEKYRETNPIKVPQKLQQQIDDIEQIIGDVYQPFADKAARWEYMLDLMPLIGARHFLRGWENVKDPYTQEPIEFRKEGSYVSLECLDKLPLHHLKAIGFMAYDLMNPTPAQEKNSKSPSA